MDFIQLKDAFTILGVTVGAVSLIFTAINTSHTKAVNRARFWLELRGMMSNFDDIHQRLRPGGDWASKSNNGPATTEEWSRIEAYMGLFEHCEIMIAQKLIDADTFGKIYSYRIQNIIGNKIIYQAKLIEHADGWTDFINLTKRMNTIIKA